GPAEWRAADEIPCPLCPPGARQLRVGGASSRARRADRSRTPDRRLRPLRRKLPTPADGRRAARLPQRRRQYRHRPAPCRTAAAGARGGVRLSDLVVRHAGHAQGIHRSGLGPGVAFELVNGRTRPLLQQLQRYAVVTTYGSPWWLNKLVVADPNRHAMMRGMRLLASRHARTLWLAI